jgi:hypothetical protein
MEPISIILINGFGIAFGMFVVEMVTDQINYYCCQHNRHYESRRYFLLH